MLGVRKSERLREGIMCGRFVASDSPAEIGHLLHARLERRLPARSWNVRPTQDIAIVLDGSDGIRRLAPAYWSLVPRTSPTLRLDFPTFNARIESALDRPTFRSSADSARAIIPVAGYYEWKGRTPWYFSDPHGPLWLAGLYSWWRIPDATDFPDDGSHVSSSKRTDSGSPGSVFGRFRLTATILTCDAVGTAARVHDRMPVILPDSLVDDWLSHQVPGFRILPAAQEEAAHQEKRLRAHAVHPLRGDGPQLLDPVSDPERSGTDATTATSGRNGSDEQDPQPTLQQYLDDLQS